MQKDVFLAGEAEKWMARNRDRLGMRDLVSDMIAAQAIHPKGILEVGACTGWRLKKLKEKYGGKVAGIDPLMPNEVPLGTEIWQGTADYLYPFKDNEFDLIIYGFCLYLADPVDYFKILAEGDRVLADHGHVLIHDFWSKTPFRREYKHTNGVFSYHFSVDQLWLGHPGYSLIKRDYAGEEAVALLKKHYAGAWKEDSQ